MVVASLEFSVLIADDVVKSSLIAGYQWVSILPNYFKISIAQ